jgi:hypothetical protein
MLLLVVIMLALVMSRKVESYYAPGRDYVLEKMAAAIMEFEGWYAGSRSQRNNNPGNLKYAGQPGAIGQDDEGHAIFSTFEDGWRALIRQLTAAFTGRSRVYSPEDTLYDFFGKYAEANSRQYAEFVAGKLGVSADETLASLAEVLRG